LGTAVLAALAIGLRELRALDASAPFESLFPGLNPQYGLSPAARSFVIGYGADPDDPRIASFCSKMQDRSESPKRHRSFKACNQL
jgi:hypothetical protein